MSGTGLIHQRVSPTTLGIVRAAVFLIWIAIVLPDPLSFFGTLPQSMFQRAGVFKLVPMEAWDRFLVPGVLDAFKAVLLGLLVLSAVGMRPYGPIALVTAALLTIHQSLVREFTFFNHEELALLVVTWLLVLFPAGDGFSWPRRRAPSAAPAVYAAGLLAMAAFLLLPYSAIAAHRIAVAAPGVFTGDSIPYWFASLSALDRDGSGLGLWVLGHHELVTLAKLGFLVTTCFELLAPLCLILPRFRRIWMVVVISFHLLNEFTLNLFFWQNALLVLLLLSPIDDLVNTAQEALARSRRRRTADATAPAA